MRTAIVTGATGFLGRWLVKELLECGMRVTAVVRPGSGNLQLLKQDDRLEIVECAMDQYPILAEKLGRREESVFYHLAWTGVSGPQRMDMSIQMENIKAAAAAVEAAAALGCTRFVGLGTIMEAEAAAVADADGSRPGAGYIYGEAKHFAHLQTKVLASQCGIDHLWAMLTNAYGEYEFSPRFINTTLRKIIRHEPLEFTAGTQIYDFVHVEDAVRALIAIGEKGKTNSSYVIGSGKATALRQFIETIGKTLAPEQALLFGNVPYTGVQLPVESFSISKLERDTGFVPRISFECGITRTMEWLRSTEDL